jgi:hypothetical protein
MMRLAGIVTLAKIGEENHHQQKADDDCIPDSQLGIERQLDRLDFASAIR